MYVQWSSQYVLGNALLDTQHRMLFLLCRKLDMAIKTGRSAQVIQRTMVEVKKFTEFHFISEQNLMFEIAYPDAEAHAKEHANLLIDLQVIFSKISHKTEFPEDFLYFLHHWLVDHFDQQDGKLAAYLKDCEVRPVGEALYADLHASSGIAPI
jgi:hemerythrin-like metal-binding protein